MLEPSPRHGHRNGSPPRQSASASALNLLRDLIVQRTGVYYNDTKRDQLEERVGELTAARGLPSLLDYYYLLRYDPDAETVWRELMDRLAVPETFFWRQPEQFEALVDEIVPRHLAERPGRPLRIWSAACCSGEEPLTIAMALEEGGWFGRLPVEIVASDASPALVARARAGVYGDRSLRNVSPERRARWFTREGAGWRIDRALHARVRWTTANLLDEAEAGPLAHADVVFCRNVFIYFSDDAVRRVARMLVARMPPTGWLFLSASESLMRLTTDFAMTEVGSAFAYVPNPGAGAQAGAEPPRRPAVSPLDQRS
ncbi:MAG TPA: protein-glutamate O-methyltransferase CheR [Longimicrobium sp.]|jgi:chemotaxis protein methyltransferase CheR